VGPWSVIRAPLGAGMSASAFSQHKKYCHNGAWPSPHHGTAAQINVVEMSEPRARLGPVGAKRSDSVQIQAGNRLVEMPWRTSQELRGRLLASGLDSLEDEFAAKGTSAPVVVDVTDKEPLLALVTAWIEAVGERRAVARGGLLDLRDALRDDLESPPPDLAGVN
jgi:hypothetical protein